MSKYNTLVNILDMIRKEAPSEFKTYHPLESEIEKVDQARARSYIHLFLKVKFGLLDFEERETFITDGADDGGIDAYFFDHDHKAIYYLQSKFRTNTKNFEKKDIELKEILKMEVDRIYNGETTDENGKRYNSKIQTFIGKLQEVEGIGRYKHIVVILANLKEIKDSDLKKLTGGDRTELYDFKRSYDELVFPIISGTYYNMPDLYININLTNKEASASKINYSVQTEFKDCEITVLFVPTIEIAKILHKYKNTILRYNPRSYLDLSTNQVNKDISLTILDKNTNEFALFNNGITMLSDDTGISEKVGKKGQGQLYVKNPQIINGGQTAYTLSKIYEDLLKEGKDIKDIFSDKEVMLKVITFDDSSNKDTNKKLSLIEAISKATNQQTEVVEADRRSNDKIQIEIQKLIFEKFGFFYERKRGEFYDGLRNYYIDSKHVINRESFLRVGYACKCLPSQARSIGAKKIFSKDNFSQILNKSSIYRDLFYGYLCYLELDKIQSGFKWDRINKFGIINYGNALRYGKFAVVTVAYYSGYKNDIVTEAFEESVKTIVNKTLNKWLQFEEYVKKQTHNKDYFYEYYDSSGKKNVEINYDGYYKGKTINDDVVKFYNLKIN